MSKKQTDIKINSDTLANAIEQLSSDLAQSRRAEDREKLAAAITDLEKLQNAYEGSPMREDEALDIREKLDRLRDELMEFEIEHPRAVALINELSMTFAGLGV